MGKYDVSIYKEVNVDTNMDEIFNELTKKDQQDFFKENLEYVLSIDESIDCYNRKDLIYYLEENLTEDEVKKLYEFIIL